MIDRKLLDQLFRGYLRESAFPHALPQFPVIPTPPNCDLIEIVDDDPSTGEIRITGVRLVREHEKA